MKEKVLTEKKYNWAKNRKTTLRGSKLNYNAGVQENYIKSIEKLVRQMTREVKKEYIELFRSESAKDYLKSQRKLESMAQDESISSQARILSNKLLKKFSQLFSLKSRSLAEKMLTQTLATSKANLKSSLEILSGGLSLKTGIVTSGVKEVSKAIVEENVSLIKSIPEQYLKNVTGEVMRSITVGKGLSDLIPAIEKYDGQTYRRARNIALDQTRKAYNAINAQRVMSIGVKQFEWLHSGSGQHPRSSHQKISGHIFNYEDLEKQQEQLGVPKSDQGLPGYPIQCKCTMRPIIKFGNYEE